MLLLMSQGMDELCLLLSSATPQRVSFRVLVQRHSCMSWPWLSRLWLAVSLLLLRGKVSANGTHPRTQRVTW